MSASNLFWGIVVLVLFVALIIAIANGGEPCGGYETEQEWERCMRQLP